MLGSTLAIRQAKAKGLATAGKAVVVGALAFSFGGALLAELCPTVDVFVYSALPRPLGRFGGLEQQRTSHWHAWVSLLLRLGCLLIALPRTVEGCTA